MEAYLETIYPYYLYLSIHPISISISIYLVCLVQEVLSPDNIFCPDLLFTWIQVEADLETIYPLYLSILSLSIYLVCLVQEVLSPHNIL